MTYAFPNIDNSEIKGDSAQATLEYDYLVIGTGATNQTFGIKGVEDHACFLKEVWDAQKIRTKVMDCIETAAFPGQADEEIERLLHMVVVGGGPTGIEYAAELHDFLKDDLASWYPGKSPAYAAFDQQFSNISPSKRLFYVELSDKIKITLVEAMPNVLPAFSKQLIDYTESTFREQNITIHTKTMVKEVKEKEIVVQQPDGTNATIPYGLLVWATGNTVRPVIRNLMAKMPEAQTVRRGLAVDDWLHLNGAQGIYALGDASATKYAPTAQVASQQGKYLARLFSQLAACDKLEEEVKTMEDGDEKEKKLRKLQKAKAIKPFEYSHQGSLA